MDQTLIMIICVCALLALVILILLVLLLGRPKKQEHKIIIKDGVDIDSGKVGSDTGEIFDGTDDPDGTVLVDGKRRSGFHITLINDATGETWSLKFRRQIGIGRVQDNRQMEQFLTIRDSRVSRLQCCIFAKDGGVYVENRSQTNVTAVNGRQIKKPKLLKTGDVIRIGNTRLRVKL